MTTVVHAVVILVDDELVMMAMLGWLKIMTFDSVVTGSEPTKSVRWVTLYGRNSVADPVRPTIYNSITCLYSDNLRSIEMMESRAIEQTLKETLLIKMYNGGLVFRFRAMFMVRV